jgi:hypothetical protein
VNRLHEYASAVRKSIGWFMGGCEQSNRRPPISSRPVQGNASPGSSFLARSNIENTSGFSVDPGGASSSEFRAVSTRRVRTSSRITARRGAGAAASKSAIASRRNIVDSPNTQLCRRITNGVDPNQSRE